MVVIAIIAVLVAVAIPVFSNYQFRAKLAEFTLAAAPAKARLVEWAALNYNANAWPAPNIVVIPEGRGRYVTSVSWQRLSDTTVARIIVAGDVDGQEFELFYDGSLQQGSVIWECKVPAEDIEFAPSGCGQA